MASKPGRVPSPGTKTRPGASSAGERPACGPGDARCKGGVSSSRALAWNRRTCRLETDGLAGMAWAARGRAASGGHRERQSTAGHRGGPARSSGEGPVTGVGRRAGCGCWRRDGRGWWRMIKAPSRRSSVDRVAVLPPAGAADRLCSERPTECESLAKDVVNRCVVPSVPEVLVEASHELVHAASLPKRTSKGMVNVRTSA